MKNVKSFEEFVNEGNITKKLSTLKEVTEELNENFSPEQKLKIVSKLEAIELFVYDNPRPKPSDIRKLCNELVELCRK